VFDALKIISCITKVFIAERVFKIAFSYMARTRKDDRTDWR